MTFYYFLYITEYIQIITCNILDELTKIVMIFFLGRMSIKIYVVPMNAPIFLLITAIIHGAKYVHLFKDFNLTSNLVCIISR